ncbi:hypothetical protein AMTRI_Chr08g165510 [Amborella trichopoda]
MSYFQLRIITRLSHCVSRRFHSPTYCISLQFNTLLAHKPCTASEESLEKALEILDLISPQPGNEGSGNKHMRLIEGCMEALIKTDSRQEKKGRLRKPKEPTAISDKISKRSVAFSGYEKDGYYKNNSDANDALTFFFHMRKQGMKPDEQTLSSVLSACGSERVYNLGTQLHAISVHSGLDLCISIGTSLVNFYSKCGDLDEAYQVFEGLLEKNVVSWTALIAGFAQQGQGERCWDLFLRMQFSLSRPNDFTYASLLKACTGIGSLAEGRVIHCHTIKGGFHSYTHVANALITMYAKCGSIEEANYMFEETEIRDVISWNAMIMAYAHHGLGDEALYLFREMEKRAIEPDAITFLGVLSSCRHVGLVEEGWHYFYSMVCEHKIDPGLDHYACMVDLLGRAGLLDQAKEFIRSMPILPNAVVWGSLLSSCRLHGDARIGSWAAQHRLLLEPGCSATYVQLANLYAASGSWEEAARVRKLMREKGLRTSPGYSWIEVKNRVYKFKAEDRSNPRWVEMIWVVDSLVKQMKSLGYVPDTSLGLDLNEEGGFIDCY